MFHSRVFGLVGLCGVSVAAQLGFAGVAGAVGDDPTITASAATAQPGGPGITLTVDASAPFEIGFTGSGNQALGWQLPQECKSLPYPAVCTPGATGKVVIPISVIGGDQGGKKGQQVVFEVKDVATKTASTVTVTFGDPVTAADWVVENPQGISFLNPGGKLAEPFVVSYFQRHTTTDSATLTVNGVQGVKFTKAPDFCSLNASGTLVTCQIKAYKGGFGPQYLPLEGVISGNEQTVETKIVGTLPENTPGDNTVRSVYKNAVEPAPATPSASPSIVKPAPTAQATDTPKPGDVAASEAPELAETGGGGGDQTAAIAGSAAGLLLVGGAAVMFARRRSRSTN
ncbi:LAETG motif-containing sortase-dependent surface protein [Yinghuangia sp. YIM S10712]|uniref:LAETG motif-containing sortase-dependent surface protein n=1 Tax=Yinghuangia sp. YIM S10712 TaxID=3436930 RepID=UPI003F53C8FE